MVRQRPHDTPAVPAIDSIPGDRPEPQVQVHLAGQPRSCLGGQLSVGVAQCAHHAQHVGDQRLGQAPALVLPPNRHPVQPAAAGLVLSGGIDIGRSRSNLLPGGILYKDHPAAQAGLIGGVIHFPSCQPLLPGRKFLGGFFNINPDVPVPRAIECKAVPIRQGKHGKRIQIPLQKELIMPDAGVVIVKLHRNSRITWSSPK